MRKAFTIFLLLELSTSCYYDKFNEIHPLDGYVNTCDDTLDDTYTAVVHNIMVLNCTSCHNKSLHNGNVILDTYDNVKKYAANGKLLGSIQHAQGYKAMPPGGSLRDCDIKQLQDWINADMPE